MAKEQITLAEDSFTITTDKHMETVRFDALSSIVVYKRDLLTIDLLCCDIFTDGTVRTVDEGTPGFGALMKALEKLPGFDREWWERVIFPAFAENRTTVFQRAS
jgi:hypothetical protein